MISNKVTKFVFLISIVLTSLYVNAQEIVDYNVPLYPNKINYEKVKSTADTLLLPFFEDFSTTYYYPDNSKWTDYDVFVNSTYSYNPPSIGVATFDAVKFDGSFYTGTYYGQTIYADALTSKPFNFKSYNAASKIYISFYYQPRGNGDAPETGDSLLLYFYKPNQQKWQKVWEKAGSEKQEFKQVIFQINDTAYFQKGFKFKFQNKISVSSSAIPGKVANCDHWNLDYIKIDKNRSITDTIYNDLAFYEPQQSFIKNYESVPLRHFADTSIVKSKINIKYRNNYTEERYIDLLYFRIKNVLENKVDTIKAGSRMSLPGKTSDNIPFGSKIYSFPTTLTDSARFEIECGINTDDFDTVSNNKIVYQQKFYNYYAYDDGTSEMGYGLSGEGTQNAQLAYKFNTFKKDTLRSVQIYFNQSLNSANLKYFYLMVWSNNPATGRPGNLICQQEGMKPQNVNLLNKFTDFPFDTLLIVEDTFYVGIMQTTSDFLNIGFDINRTSNQNLFFNISGVWQQSKISGALMMRPVFGKSLASNVGVNKITDVDFDFNLYPNPANEQIEIELPDNATNSEYKISIYSLQGKLIKVQENSTILNISDVTDGMYIVNYRDKSGSVSKKLVIKH